MVMQQKMLGTYNCKIHCFRALNHFGNLSLMLNCKMSILHYASSSEVFDDHILGIADFMFLQFLFVQPALCFLFNDGLCLFLVDYRISSMSLLGISESYLLNLLLFVAVFLLLFSTDSSFTHLNVPDPCIIPWINKTNVPKNTLSNRVNESMKNILDWSLYLELHQKLIGSVLGQYPSPIQVLWKSIQ